MKPMHPLLRLKKIIRDCEQLIIDKTSYCDNHPEVRPFDCEWERVMIDLARKCEAAWQTPEFDDRYADMVAHTKNAHDVW